MKRIRGLCTLIVTAAVLAGGSLEAQTNDDWEIVSTFPFAASFAVANDPTGDVIYMGAGSGFIGLNGSADDPAPLTGTGDFDYRARCRGLVRDIKVTTNSVWVAAGVGGLQRWNRASNELDFAFDLGEAPPYAWCLDVVHNSADGSDYAVVGSNELEVGGKVYIVKIDSQGTATLKDVEDLSTPIYSVAASLTLSTNTLSVFVGKRCDSASTGCDSLRRYEVPTSTYAFPTNFQAWGINGCTTPVMVRDILLDESGSTKVAYVAASVQGIRKFTLTSGSLQQVTSGGFPIFSISGSVNRRFDSIALYDVSGTRLLVTAMGPAFSAERQWFGLNNQPVGCDSNLGPSSEGVAVFDLADNPIHNYVGKIDVGVGNSHVPKSPLSLAVRPNGTGQFLIDVACSSNSLAVIEAEYTGGSPKWNLTKVGSWNEDNSVEAEKVPGGSFDDVAIVQDPATGDDFLMAPTEGTLPSFAVSTDPNEMLNTVAGISGVGTVLLCRVSYELPVVPTVLYGDHNFGPTLDDPLMRFYDLSGGADHPVASDGVLHTGNKGYMSFLAPGLDDSLWLYVVGPGDIESVAPPGGCPSCTPPREAMANGGIRVYRVSDDNDHQFEEPGSMTTPRIGLYAPSICCDKDGEHFAFSDVVVKVDGADEAVWANYAPLADETKGGLAYLSAHWTGEEVAFTFLGKISFDAAEQCNVSGRLTYDASRRKLYSSFGTAGVAMYDLADPFAPTEVAEFSWTQPASGPEISSLQVWPGPENYVYVSLMHVGIGIIDATDAATFAQGFVLGSPFKLPGIANAFADAPVIDDELYPPGSAVYVADAAGGVHWVQFKVFDAP